MTEHILYGVLYPHLGPQVGPADHGAGRRCADCEGPVSRYTPPQPVTGRVQCNLCSSLPEGYTLSGAGRVVKERAA